MEQYGVFHSYAYGPDEDTGEAIVRMRIAPGKYIICEANGCQLPISLTYGTPLLVTGEYRRGKHYLFPYEHERSFLCKSMVQTMPLDEATAVEFVENMEIRGIADANARHIVGVTGPDIAAYFRRNPDARDFKDKIPSLRLPAAEAFIRRIMTTTTQKELLDTFSPCGLTYKDAFALYQHIIKDVGHECTMREVLDVLQPHVLNIQGQIPRGLYYYAAKADIEFDTVDAIGHALGYRAYHPERLTTLVFKAMLGFAGSGHTWSSLDDIYASCKALIKKTEFSGFVISKWALYSAIRMGRGIFKEENNGERVYLESSWFDERTVVAQLRRIQGSAKVLPYYETIVDEIEQERGVSFSAAQKKCFQFLKKSGVHIVTGGAGTGKTTTISGLLSAYTKLNPASQIALCAPTGRAAQRMTELCSTFGENVRAYTVHKLLEFAPFGGETLPTYNEQNPLNADLIIVDEMSMVDLHLFAILTQAVKDGASVILCGDVSQLSSVASGNVFNDLIESKKFETVFLDTNYRQANSGNANNIIDNANRINEGKWNLTVGPDFDIIVCESDEDMEDTVIRLARQNPNQTVLSTVHENSGGVSNLNKLLQPLMNPTVGGSVQCGGNTFYENDHIIMMRNDYNVGYVNGDVGFIESIGMGSMVVNLGGNSKTIEKANFKDVALAYSMTIHKSQGSEYDSVVVVLPSHSYSMLTRNLLYTAVTRAKKHVTIVCQEDAIEQAVQNTRAAERRTTLKELLCT